MHMWTTMHPCTQGKKKKKYQHGNKDVQQNIITGTHKSHNVYPIMPTYKHPNNNGTRITGRTGSTNSSEDR